MPNQTSGGMSGGYAPPMKRITHTTKIEEPDKNFNGIPDSQERATNGRGFLQSMVHPAFQRPLQQMPMQPQQMGMPSGVGGDRINAMPGYAPSNIGPGHPMFQDALQRLLRSGRIPPWFQAMFAQRM